jgi:hypothetical protein
MSTGGTEHVFVWEKSLLVDMLAIVSGSNP